MAAASIGGAIHLMIAIATLILSLIYIFGRGGNVVFLFMLIGALLTILTWNW